MTCEYIKCNKETSGKKFCSSVCCSRNSGYKASIKTKEKRKLSNIEYLKNPASRNVTETDQDKDTLVFARDVFITIERMNICTTFSSLKRTLPRGRAKFTRIDGVKANKSCSMISLNEIEFMINRANDKLKTGYSMKYILSAELWIKRWKRVESYLVKQTKIKDKK